MPDEKTPIEKVYDQLSGAPIRHPASARLFADWRLQAGDVVTVTSGNESYQVPVYNMEMTWKGSPMVEVDATGSKERPPLPALARRSYGGSQRQAETDETLSGYSSHFEKTDSQIIGIVEANGIVLGEDGLPLIVDGEYVFSDESNNSVYSQIRQNAGEITSEVTRATGAESSLSSRISQTESDISLVVTGTSGNRTVNSASIILAINGGSGSSVTISADKVDLVGYVTATQMETAIQTVNYIIPADGTIQVSGNMDVGGNLGVGSISTESYADYKVDGTSIGLGSGIKGFGTPTTSGDQVSIPYYSFDGLHDGNITFRKAAAATIQGTWGSGKFTVSATSGTANTVITSLTNTGHWGSATNEGEVLTTYYYETKATIGTSATLYNTGNKTQISAASKLTTASVTPSFVQTVDVEPTGTYFGLTKVTIAKATISTTREANKPTGTELVQTFAQNGYYKAGTDGCVYVNVPIPTVTLEDPTWERSGSNITYNNRYTVAASNGAYKEQMLYLTTSGLTVSLRTDTEGGTVRAKVTCKDNDLVAGNIKSGVNIFGVTGTYTGTTYANQTTLTRRNASTDGSYRGYLYRLESDGKTYTRLGSSNSYWYTTSANLGSTKTVHYD